MTFRNFFGKIVILKIFTLTALLSVTYSIVLSIESRFFGPITLIAILFSSALLADLLSSLVHFSFDYVLSDRMPLLGSVVQSFRRHHDNPVLDPTTSLSNLAMGATAALPLSIAATIVLAIDLGLPSYLGGATLAAMSVWGLFFHQIHAYAHMGAHIDVEDWNQRVDEIMRSDSHADQREKLKQLFDELPIPKFIRRLQRWRILLDPVDHVFHHTDAESNFSSVNGWSNPIANPILGPLARIQKRRQLKQMVG
ncbi:Kua-ubiquitin conjugating enzyme hybrid localization domain-containing protein [Rhizobium etli]|uniref:Kua-ubiquitin conjugating enzyme hybrid localization domain-containing protein n=1 Tax=Rhizobium etli TaxID=29449 RepID=UPI000383929D|nr:Kua-ubiquitin conjugating enzyme hybrid localization domain-containing protein [Rhizobium etli]AGS25647.1 Kua-ubiquitin conjugating enzyme hybrid localization domain-containing protein [Rhizobium etli bv. mimosae str. Mim1]